MFFGLIELELWLPWQHIAAIDLLWEIPLKSIKPRDPLIMYIVCGNV